jgi:hypothetical protein
MASNSVERPRALYYFKTIFNSLESTSGFNFCAQGPTTATADQVEFLSNHEAGET